MHENVDDVRTLSKGDLLLQQVTKEDEAIGQSRRSRYGTKRLLCVTKTTESPAKFVVDVTTHNCLY